MDYDLFRLNSRSFEQLTQGIAARVLGPGLVIFGDGPDGGREATFNAEVPYPTEEDHWIGHIVLQAKFRQRSEGRKIDGEWALQQLREELIAFTDPDSTRELPEYLIFATNVTCSPVKDSGVKDKMFTLAAESGLTGFDIWDYDKLRVYLDLYEEMRRSYSAYILPGDVLAETVEVLGQIKQECPDFDDAISRFLQKELLADQWANLEQAGRAAEEQVPVSRVFVDLPFSAQRQAEAPSETPGELIPGFVAAVVNAASRRLDPQAQNAQRSDHETLEGEAPAPEGRIVLLGGPGQGKSTIGQFVCQMFRAALLRSRPPDSLSDEVTDALDALEAHCDADSLALPTVRRFPLRVELSKFADELGAPDGSSSLLEYLGKLVSSRIQSEISPALMSSWLGSYPWLLVLDGLDEVPASGHRGQLMEAIRDFWVDISEENADCLVIATTRPQGYNDEFSPRYYRHLWLTPLSTARALHYADRLLKVRFLEDTDRREKIATRLKRAADRPDTARLMTSPLQVTIMATLLERMGQPPEGRWNLFSQYYRVIYDRELERDIPAASVLRDYKPDIDAIHHRVGLLLQVESESAEQAESQISRERFTEVVKARLREEELDHGDEGLVRQIIDTAMDRLVFLVGLEADQVGFEIRSLQEFMAAEALLHGGDGTVEQRLRAIAPLPTWRNTFLFAAGRCFADLQHLRDTVHTISAELNDLGGGDPLTSLVLPGSGLAIDLLTDGVAQRQPRYGRLLAREALRIIRRPPGELNDRLAEVYQEALGEVYETELRTGLAFESFHDTLGAWRTLAVLAARGVDWAAELLKTRLPAPEEVGSLLLALPPRAASTTLSGILSNLCAAAPPSESLPFEQSIRDLELLEGTPDWFRAFFLLYTERWNSQETKLRLQEASGEELTVEVRLIAEPEGPLDRAISILGDTKPSAAPTSWLPFFIALEFGRDPSAATLAKALERYAEIEPIEELWRLGVYSSWPLAGLVLAAETNEQLREYAEIARSGGFGDLDDWLAAEKRWQEAGIETGDMTEAKGGVPLFDSEIATRGFPFDAATVTAGEARRSAALIALSWLERIENQPTRRFISNVFFWLLGALNPTKEGPEISSSRWAATIRQSDLQHYSTRLSLRALNEFDWPTELGEPEVGALDWLGDGFGRFEDTLETTLDGDLRANLRAAWTADPNHDGLYRLIALGWPVAADPVHPDAATLVPDQNPDSVASALLALKLTKDPGVGALKTLAEADPPWVDAAIAALNPMRRPVGAEALISAFDPLLPADRWRQRRTLTEFSTELIAHRSSALAGASTWEELQMFERPQTPRAGG
jgi:hypothetical protein